MSGTDQDVPAGGIRVLVVEDDARMLDIIVRHLDRMGYTALGAGGGAAALEQIGGFEPDVVLSDIRMPGMDGRTLMQLVRERHPEVKVVLMTAFGSVESAVEAMRDGAYSYLCKPFKVEEVAAVLRNIGREIGLRREVLHLRRECRCRYSAESLIGRSSRMQQVRGLIAEASSTTAPVLITGRSGTGKELCARAIHFGGGRAAGPFVPVNCAAVPESLFESEMFGYCKGAFTGAARDQPGLIEQSSGGTLFLDELGEIPLPQQAKLLRVIEERELRRLGGSRAQSVDLRLVCATNRSLEAMVKQGEFREDLYYRVDVLRIHMPELAGHAEDIAPLSEHLLVDLAQEHGVRCPGFTPEALAALERHRWPGNVRELRNVLERALFRAAGRLLDVADLPAEIGGAAEPGSASLPPDLPRMQTLAELEKDHVEKVLAACQWNRSSAARVLGIDRRTLFSKIQRYGLVGPLRSGADGDEP
jgi:DNA-binding NtrC family response regulator